MPCGNVMRSLVADRVGQFVGPHRAVGVAEAPELLGIAQILRRDIVEPFALRHRVFLQQRRTLRRRHETALQIDDRAPSAVASFAVSMP